MGHVHYLSNDYSKAKEFYERTLAYARDAVDLHATCLRLGSIYLEEKQADSVRTNSDDSFHFKEGWERRQENNFPGGLRLFPKFSFKIC